jgi:hypothetical protein
MNKSILLAGLASLLIGGGVFAGCSSDEDDGDGNTTDNTGGAGATGGENTGAVGAQGGGPGQGGAGQGGAGQGGAGQGGAGQGGAGQGGGPEQLGCDAAVPPDPVPSAGACVTVAEPIACNPVTNAGCEGAGQACDANNQGGFNCFDPPNDAALCAACDASAGPFCVAGATCIGEPPAATCAKYCCDDGDCGDGTCIKVDANNDPAFPAAPDLGFCF